MSTCSSCGAARSDSGPFCPVCGADGRATVDWLGASPGSSPLAVSTAVVRSGVGRPNAMMVGVGLVAVMVLGWAALGRSGDAPAESAGPSTTVAPAGDSGSTTTEPATTTTAPRRTTTSTTEPVPGGPVLGYEIGLVAIGGSEILDLDTGRRVDVELPGRLVGVVDRYLVTFDDNATWAVPLADLAASPVKLAEGEIGAEQQLGRSRTENALWVSGDWTTWQLVDLATGSVLDRIEVDSGFWNNAPGVSALGPELASPRSGGVFEWQSPGYRRVRDGALLAASGETAVVSECDDTMRCVGRAYRITDWSTLGDPVEMAGGWSTLYAMGRILFHETDDGRPRLLDLATGEEALFLSETDVWAEGFQSDESGRFVTFRRSVEVRLLDLDTGAVADLDLFGDAVLVPRDDVAWLLGAQP